MAQRETPDSEEQMTGGNTLPVSKDFEEVGRNHASEVADKNTGSMRDSDMAPSDLETSNELKTPPSPQTTQNSLVS